MLLSSTEEKFILHWGEMGARWGVNRSMSQIHALLYLSTDAITAEEIGETLRVARSNVSVSLKELQAWDLIQTERKLGDRSVYYMTLDDPWELARRIVKGRKTRELDPTLGVLRDCVIESQDDADLSSETRKRLKDTMELMEAVDALFNQFVNLPRPVLRTFVMAAPKIRKFVESISPKKG